MTALAADGQSSEYSFVNGADGVATFLIWGTLGGGTIVIEVSPDGGTTWIPTAISRTTPGMESLSLSAGSYLIRANLSGATAPNVNGSVIS